MEICHLGILKGILLFIILNISNTHSLWPYCFNYCTQPENDRKTSCLEGVQKGYLSCQKWYIKGKGSGLRAEYN